MSSRRMSWPSERSSRTRARIFAAASENGFTEPICEPVWQATPTARIPGSEAEPVARKQHEQRQVRRRFHREASKDVETAKRRAEDARVPQQGRRRIDVGRRPHLLRQLRERHLFAAELPFAALEVVHRLPPS